MLTCVTEPLRLANIYVETFEWVVDTKELGITSSHPSLVKIVTEVQMDHELLPGDGILDVLHGGADGRQLPDEVVEPRVVVDHPVAVSVSLGDQ